MVASSFANRNGGHDAAGGCWVDGVEGVEGTFFDRLQKVSDFELIGGEDAFDEGAAGACAAGDQHLAVEAGRGCDDVGLLGEAGDERTPIAYAVSAGFHQIYVGGCADEPFLKIASHTAGDGEGDDEGSYTCGYADDRNCCH